MVLLNPKKYSAQFSDKESEEIMRKTIDFFETKGLKKILDDDHNYVWYDDFLQFQKDNQIFAKLFTPKKYGDETSRWDTYRIVNYAEILGFYGLCYWYTFQVSALGLGPIWLAKTKR
jgi:acyl-CoA dehydrogenase